MTEILTESFCERCGTRYTFEPVAPRRKALRGIGTLGRGIRHFVSDPGSTIDEAMAVARSEQEQRSTANALEAFHRTFNFCLSCRQYTCADCWNAVEGRCLSCAPTPDAAPPVAREDTPVALAAATLPPMSMAPAAMDLGAVPASDEDGEHGPADADAQAAAEEAAAREVEEAQEAERIAAEQAAELAAERAAAEEAAEREASALLEAEARAQEEADAAAAAERMAAVAAEAAAAAEEARLAAENEAARAAAHEEAERIAAEEARARAEADAMAAAQAEADAAAAALARAEAAAVAAMQAAEQRARIEEEARAEAEARAAAEAQARSTEPAAAAPTLAFEPGLNLDEELAAYERQHAAAQADGIVPPEPEPVPYEPIPTAVGRPIPASLGEAEPPAWPDPQVAAAAFEPHWPDVPVARSAIPTPPEPARSEGATPVAPVVPGGARACPSCGLSLSASARFCRRCGTPQQVVGTR